MFFKRAKFLAKDAENPRTCPLYPRWHVPQRWYCKMRYIVRRVLHLPRCMESQFGITGFQMPPSVGRREASVQGVNRVGELQVFATWSETHLVPLATHCVPTSTNPNLS